MTITERYADVKNTLRSNGLLEPSILAHVIKSFVDRHGIVEVMKLIDLEDVWVYFREFGVIWCLGSKAEIRVIDNYQMRRSLDSTRLMQLPERGLPITLLTW